MAERMELYKKQTIMKKLILLVSIVFCFTQMIHAQMLTPSESDPAAKVILQNLKRQYDKYSSVEIDFQLTRTASDDTDIQKGKIIQQGKNFNVNSRDFQIISDNKSLWFFNRDHNNVQISDAEYEESDEIMSPLDILKLYNSNNYVYAIVDKKNTKNGTLNYIEFKPLDKFSEYSKIRVVVNEKINKIVSLTVFMKDSTRLLFEISNQVTDKKYDSATFSFNEKDHPGINKEDLRIE